MTAYISENQYYQKLRQAIKKGDHDMFTTLMKMVTIFDHHDTLSFYLRAFLHAARYNQVEMLKYGLEKYAKKTGKSKAYLLNNTIETQGKKNALHLATQWGSFEAACYIIEEGANINIKDDSHRTPLHYAVFYNRVKFIKLLVIQNANLVARNNSGKTADRIIDLHKYSDDQTPQTNYLKKQREIFNSAIQSGNLTVVREFVEENPSWLKVKLDHFGNRALHVAASSNHVVVLKFILKKMAGESGTSKTHILDHCAARKTGAKALHNAAANGAVDTLLYILKQDVAIDVTTTSQNTALHFAVRYQRKAVVDLLILHNANLLLRNNENKRADEHILTDTDNKQATKRNFILEIGEALFAAIKRGDLKTVREYVDSNRYLAKLPLNQGQTAFHFAARLNRIEILKYMVNRDCQENHDSKTGSLTPVDQYGMTPLAYLCLFGKKSEHEEISSLCRPSDSKQHDRFKKARLNAIKKITSKEFPMLISFLAANPALLQHFKINKRFANRIKSIGNLIELIRAKPELSNFLLKNKRINKWLARECEQDPEILANLISVLPLGILVKQERVLKKLMRPIRSTKEVLKESIKSWFGWGVDLLTPRLSILGLVKAVSRRKRRIQATAQRHVDTFINETVKNSSQCKLKMGEISLFGLFDQPQSRNIAAQHFMSVDPSDTENFIEAQYQMAAIYNEKYSHEQQHAPNSKFGNSYKEQTIRAHRNIVEAGSTFLNDSPNHAVVKQAVEDAKSSIKLSQSKHTLWAVQPDNHKAIIDATQSNYLQPNV